MAKYTCHCGATYALREGSAGKRAKCKKCGEIFVIPEEPEVIPLADADDDWDFQPPSTKQPAVLAASASGSLSGYGSNAGQSVEDAKAYVEAGRTAPIAPGGSRTFGGDILWTFLFFADLRNAVTFLFVWLLLSVLAGIPCLGILVTGWFCAFRFEVMANAANGEDNLPGISVTSYLDDVFIPLFKWLLSWILVIVPAFAYLVYTIVNSIIKPNSAISAAAGGLGSMVGLADSDTILLLVLLLLGAASWPILILCLGLGGVECMFSVARMAKTVVRTFPVYVGVVALMIGFILVVSVMREALNVGPNPAAGVSFSTYFRRVFLWNGLIIGVWLYGEIVTMRIIGLYYHHCKDRFAWNWG